MACHHWISTAAATGSASVMNSAAAATTPRADIEALHAGSGLNASGRSTPTGPLCLFSRAILGRNASAAKEKTARQIEAKRMQRSRPTRARRRHRRGGSGAAASGAKALLVGLFELPQQLVSLADGGIERRLGGFAAGEGMLQLILDDIANEHERADAQAARILGRRVQRDLLDRNVGAGIAVVESLHPGQIVGVARDRQVAGRL